MAGTPLNLRRDCPHGGKHKHGTQSAYQRDTCRCALCRRALSEHRARIRKLHAYGRWNYYVDAEPVRAHVQTLRAAGMGQNRITQKAGLSPAVINRLLYGRPGYPPTRKLHRASAEAILGVTVDIAPGAFIDATGTRRRVQALIAVGWSMAKLSQHLGYVGNRAWVLAHADKVTQATADRVKRMYDELWDKQPPRTCRNESRAATMAKRKAAAAGWVPPLAWDDDTIDDPAAQPDLGADPEPRGKVKESRATRPLDEIAVERAMAGMLRFPRSSRPIPEQLEAIRRLAGRGMNDYQIGQRLRMNRDTVCQNRTRHGIPAGRESAA